MYDHIILPIVAIVTLSTFESVDQQYPSQTLSVSLLVDNQRQKDKVKQNEKYI